jgi:hypothetical protein
MDYRQSTPTRLQLPEKNVYGGAVRATRQHSDMCAALTSLPCIAGLRRVTLNPWETVTEKGCSLGPTSDFKAVESEF